MIYEVLSKCLKNKSYRFINIIYYILIYIEYKIRESKMILYPYIYIYILVKDSQVNSL